MKRKEKKKEEGKAEAGRLKQGAAGDAPGGGRRRVRRFAPRLPVTCLGFNPLAPIHSLPVFQLLLSLSLSLFHFSLLRVSHPPCANQPRHFGFLNTRDDSRARVNVPRLPLLSLILILLLAVANFIVTTSFCFLRLLLLVDQE